MPGPGFKKYPENINRNGRPTKGNAIAEMVRWILDQGFTIDPKTKELKVKNRPKSPTMRYLFAERLVLRSLSSNSASRLVIHSTDGLPLQSVRHVGDGGVFGRIELWDVSREEVERDPNVEGQDKNTHSKKGDNGR